MPPTSWTSSTTRPSRRRIGRAFRVGDDRRTRDTHRSVQVRQARTADSLPLLHRRRRLSRRLLQGRYRRTPGVLGPDCLGWSRAMAPVIMGTPDRPELQDELADTFCRADPSAPGSSPAPHSSPTTAPTSSDTAAHAGDRVQPGRHRSARGGRLRPRACPWQSPGHLGRGRTLPARQRSRRHRIGDRRLCPVDVTDRSVENFWNTPRRARHRSSGRADHPCQRHPVAMAWI